MRKGAATRGLGGWADRGLAAGGGGGKRANGVKA
jgi:hypothetical protein